MVEVFLIKLDQRQHELVPYLYFQRVNIYRMFIIRNLLYLSILSLSCSLNSGGVYKTSAPSSSGSYKLCLPPIRLTPKPRPDIGPL